MHYTNVSRHTTSSKDSASVLSPFMYAKYTVASVSHPDGNEDRIVADARLGLAAVFDGVGSGAGAVASQIAARVVRHGWKKASVGILPGNAPDQPDIPSVLKLVLEDAHQHLLPGKVRLPPTTKEDSTETETTVVLAVFHQMSHEEDFIMYYAHVGDSRIYLLRSGEPLLRLTGDDGYMAKLIKEGTLSKADALRIDQTMTADQLNEQDRELFDKRNGISQALGYTKMHEIHTGQVALIPGDRILLCSDGVHDNLLDREIEETLRQKSPRTVARNLVQRAIWRSQEDGTTTIRAKADDMSALVVTYRGMQFI